MGASHCSHGKVSTWISTNPLATISYLHEPFWLSVVCSVFHSSRMLIQDGFRDTTDRTVWWKSFVNLMICLSQKSSMFFFRSNITCFMGSIWTCLKKWHPPQIPWFIIILPKWVFFVATSGQKKIPHFGTNKLRQAGLKKNPDIHMAMNQYL